jgi:hypothetical protein
VDDANLMGYSINTITINVELITLVGEQIDLAVNTGKGREIKGIVCPVRIGRVAILQFLGSAIRNTRRNEFMRFVLQTTISINITVFWDVTPFNMVDVHRRF